MLRPIFIILAKFSTQIYDFEPENHNFNIHILFLLKYYTHIYNLSQKTHPIYFAHPYIPLYRQLPTPPPPAPGLLGATALYFIRCTVVCILNAQIGEFQCFSTKPYTQNLPNPTICLPSGQLLVMLLTWNRTPRKWYSYKLRMSFFLSIYINNDHAIISQEK